MLTDEGADQIHHKVEEGWRGPVPPTWLLRLLDLVARAGGTTLIPLAARLHPFTKAGMGAAFDAARQLHADHDDQWIFFIARVVVEGDWDDPDDVQPVWRVEGLPGPEAVMLYFE